MESGEPNFLEKNSFRLFVLCAIIFVVSFVGIKLNEIITLSGYKCRQSDAYIKFAVADFHGVLLDLTAKQKLISVLGRYFDDNYSVENNLIDICSVTRTYGYSALDENRMNLKDISLKIRTHLQEVDAQVMFWGGSIDDDELELYVTNIEGLTEKRTINFRESDGLEKILYTIVGHSIADLGEYFLLEEYSLTEVSPVVKILGKSIINSIEHALADGPISGHPNSISKLWELKGRLLLQSAIGSNEVKAYEQAIAAFVEAKQQLEFPDSFPKEKCRIENREAIARFHLTKNFDIEGGFRQVEKMLALQLREGCLDEQRSLFTTAMQALTLYYLRVKNDGVENIEKAKTIIDSIKYDANKKDYREIIYINNTKGTLYTAFAEYSDDTEERIGFYAQAADAYRRARNSARQNGFALADVHNTSNLAYALFRIGLLSGDSEVSLLSKEELDFALEKIELIDRPLDWNRIRTTAGNVYFGLAQNFNDAQHCQSALDQFTYVVTSLNPNERFSEWYRNSANLADTTVKCGQINSNIEQIKEGIRLFEQILEVVPAKDVQARSIIGNALENAQASIK